MGLCLIVCYGQDKMGRAPAFDPFESHGMLLPPAFKLSFSFHLGSG